MCVHASLFSVNLSSPAPSLLCSLPQLTVPPTPCNGTSVVYESTSIANKLMTKFFMKSNVQAYWAAYTRMVGHNPPLRSQRDALVQFHPLAVSCFT